MALSYADAVSLMGGQQSRTVTALDRLTGGLLLGASAAGAGFALSLFGPKAELARLSNDLLGNLTSRIRGLDRLTRSEQLAAAHSVMVLTAYFEILSRADLPFHNSELEFSGEEQIKLAGGKAAGSRRLGSLAAGLLRSDVPMPAPQRSYEATLEIIHRFYADLSAKILHFISGLNVWDRLDETRQDRFSIWLSSESPDLALVKYTERFQELAGQFPEFRFWANLADHQATRAQVRRLGIGMEGLERMLADIATGQLPDDRRQGLSRAYQAALLRPVLTVSDAPQGLHLPLLGDAYVNPDFRVAAAGLAERFTEDAWWDEQVLRDDLEGFLFGYLTTPQAMKAPLLVLGQPGSGKSVLTQVLAARLPAEAFLTVRVVLGEATADADLQAQIEDAVRSATGESLAWPNLVRSAVGALPVILLDGFDELLQATGVNQTDYLRKVALFQAREADQGRPVAVLVTSRIAVADRAQPPPDMVVARLEPFREAQIEQWLRVWNGANSDELAARGLEPLTSQVLLEHMQLASQPLLLLMLALYDADSNPLQRLGAELRKAELYERLLASFAAREIRKTGANLSPAQFREAVERELLRLSVVAFSMFSRGRQWVRESELDSDLRALLGSSSEDASTVGLRAQLSPAQLALGRFFFVHEARATRDNMRLHTYEFLHATFGEYLIARLVARELTDLSDAAQLAAGRTRPEPTDDAFLHALLSYMPLTMGGAIMPFLAERLQSLPSGRRQKVSSVLLGLFRKALGPRPGARYGDYMPQELSVPGRYAAYSANVATLTVLAVEQITGSELFPAARDPVEEWRKIATFWRSQLPREGWIGLIGAVALDRVWAVDRRDIILRSGEETRSGTPNVDLHWSYGRGPEEEFRQSGRPFGWMYVDDDWLREQAWFLCDNGDDTLIHALEPFANDLDAAISGFHSYWPDQGRVVSTAHALISLWLAHRNMNDQPKLTATYETCLEIVIRGRFAPNKYRTTLEPFRIVVLRQLASDQNWLPEDWLRSVIRRIREAANRASDEVIEGAALLRIANEIFPELMASDP